MVPNDMAMDFNDIITVNDLRLSATIGPGDRWGKLRATPIVLSLQLESSLAEAGASDDVSHTVDYGELTKRITSMVEGMEWISLRALAEGIIQLSFSHPRTLSTHVHARALNQFLQAESLEVILYRDKSETKVGIDQVWIRNLKVACIIGVNEPERQYKQIVESDIIFDDPGWVIPDWRAMHDALVQTIATSSYFTLEALALAIARTACFLPGATRVIVRARKPSALVNAAASGVQIARDRSFFEKDP